MYPSNKLFYWLKLAKSKIIFRFKSSKDYWEKWHKKNLKLQDFEINSQLENKIKYLNSWIDQYNIDSIIDFGCGTSPYIENLKCKNYLGVDVSETAIKVCQNKFKNDPSKRFNLMNKRIEEKSIMTVSLDVVYYLVEDNVFNQYMLNLFNSSNRFVIIYSTNYNHYNELIPYIKHRQITDWVKKHKKEFAMINHIKKADEGAFSEHSTELFLYEKMILK